MNGTLLETRQLGNGTTLHLVDASRPQAADRWIVVLEARIDIPVSAQLLPPELADGLSPAAVQAVLGSGVTYVSRKERVFVPTAEMEALLAIFQDEFCRNALPYLALPAFPARFILRQYKEIQKRRSLRQTDPVHPDAVE
jgi:hypothetical protein